MCLYVYILSHFLYDFIRVRIDFHSLVELRVILAKNMLSSLRRVKNFSYLVKNAWASIVDIR